jgi:hypothetical protein
MLRQPQQARPQEFIRIFLADGSWRSFIIDPWTTAGEICRMFAKKIYLPEFTQSFQLKEFKPLGFERWVSNNELVCAIKQKWTVEGFNERQLGEVPWRLVFTFTDEAKKRLTQQLTIESLPFVVSQSNCEASSSPTSAVASYLRSPNNPWRHKPLPPPPPTPLGVRFQDDVIMYKYERSDPVTPLVDEQQHSSSNPQQNNTSSPTPRPPVPKRLGTVLSCANSHLSPPPNLTSPRHPDGGMGGSASPLKSSALYSTNTTTMMANSSCASGTPISPTASSTAPAGRPTPASLSSRPVRIMLPPPPVEPPPPHLKPHSLCTSNLLLSKPPRPPVNRNTKPQSLTGHESAHPEPLSQPELPQDKTFTDYGPTAEAAPSVRKPIQARVRVPPLPSSSITSVDARPPDVNTSPRDSDSSDERLGETELVARQPSPKPSKPPPPPLPPKPSKGGNGAYHDLNSASSSSALSTDGNPQSLVIPRGMRQRCETAPARPMRPPPRPSPHQIDILRKRLMGMAIALPTTDHNNGRVEDGRDWSPPLASQLLADSETETEKQRQSGPESDCHVDTTTSPGGAISVDWDAVLSRLSRLGDD